VREKGQQLVIVSASITTGIVATPAGPDGALEGRPVDADTAVGGSL
jgi:hypothetical protein